VVMDDNWVNTQLRGRSSVSHLLFFYKPLSYIFLSLLPKVLKLSAAYLYPRFSYRT
jgi:hypothetical protein